MRKVLFTLAACMFFLVSCNKETGSDSRYYVKYTGSTASLHIVETIYSVAGENGLITSRSTGQFSDYSVTIGPVKKGFQASISCVCGETESYYIKSQSVTIEVSKDGEPFALKATGTNQASYTIDY